MDKQSKIVFIAVFVVCLIAGFILGYYLRPVIESSMFTTRTVVGHLVGWNDYVSTIDNVTTKNGYALYMDDVVYDNLIYTNQHELWFSDVLYPVNVWDACVNHTVKITYCTNYRGVSEVTNLLDISEP